MKNIYEVKITKQAQKHIRDIFDYIVNELLATGAANNLMDKMHKTIASLNQNPKRFQLIDEEPWKNMGIRKVIVNHFLFNRKLRLFREQKETYVHRTYVR